MTAYRQIIGHARTPVQQSMTNRPRDYAAYRLGYPVLGVVLSIDYADSPENRGTIYRQNSRGAFHRCSVLVVDSGQTTNVVLDHVVIPPAIPSGAIDYYEYLPKPCKGLLTGQPLNSDFINTNPNELDGDWCIVQFIGGNIDAPFISSWWPHSRNTFDPMTSGMGNPVDGVGTALNQTGRMYTRINGVEYVITKSGDVYFSTYYANSQAADLSKPSTDGRPPKILRKDVGGSIKVSVKPSQTLELSWATPVSGFGVNGAADPSVPQANPPDYEFGLGSTTGMSIKVSETDFAVSAPGSAALSSSGTTQVTSSDLLRLASSGDMETGVHGSSRVNIDIDSFNNALGKMLHRGVKGTTIEAGLVHSTVTPVAPLNVTSSGVLVISSGVRIDPAEPASSTSATPAELQILSTGNMSVRAGYDDDPNLPKAKVTIQSNEAATLASDTMVYLGNTDSNIADQPFIRGTDYSDAEESFLTALSTFASAIAVATVNIGAAKVELDPASLSAFQTAINTFKNSKNTYLSSKVKGE